VNHSPTGWAQQDWSLCVRIYYTEVSRSRVQFGAREAEHLARGVSLRKGAEKITEISDEGPIPNGDRSRSRRQIGGEAMAAGHVEEHM
jgi:hypothetical protein